MQVPTVRVRAETPLGFKRINASDLTADHELMPDEERSDDAETHLHWSSASYSSPLAAFVAKTLAARVGMTVEAWRALPQDERDAHLAEASAELDGDADFSAAEAETYAAARTHDNAITPHVAKGPKGLWFVMRGKDRVGAGFATEAEAQAALDGGAAA